MQLKSIALFFSSSPFLSVFALLNKKEMRGNPVCGSARTAAREGAAEKKIGRGIFFLFRATLGMFVYFEKNDKDKREAKN